MKLRRLGIVVCARAGASAIGPAREASRLIERKARCFVLLTNVRGGGDELAFGCGSLGLPGEAHTLAVRNRRVSVLINIRTTFQKRICNPVRANILQNSPLIGTLNVSHRLHAVRSEFDRCPRPYRNVLSHAGLRRLCVSLLFGSRSRSQARNDLTDPDRRDDGRRDEEGVSLEIMANLPSLFFVHQHLSPPKY